MMTTPALAFGPERGQINRAEHNLLARPRIGLGENPAVEVDDHAAAGPRKGRMIRGASTLVGRHDVSKILDRAPD